MSIWCDITGSIDSKSLYELLGKDKTIIPLHDLQLSDINTYRLGKVFINGIWYACTS